MKCDLFVKVLFSVMVSGKLRKLVLIKACAASGLSKVIIQMLILFSDLQKIYNHKISPFLEHCLQT